MWSACQVSYLTSGLLALISNMCLIYITFKISYKIVALFTENYPSIMTNYMMKITITIFLNFRNVFESRYSVVSIQLFAYLLITDLTGR